MKKPLQSKLQGLSIQSVVFASPLQEIDQANSNFLPHFDIYRFYLLDVPKSNTFIDNSLHTTRLMRDRWWSNCARFIRKAGKSCCINRSTPRTDRQSKRSEKLFTAKGQPSIHRWLSIVKKGR